MRGDVSQHQFADTIRHLIGHKMTAVYRGDVANLFIERAEHKFSVGAYDKYSNAELLEILQQEARALLEDHSDGADGPHGKDRS